HWKSECARIDGLPIVTMLADRPQNVGLPQKARSVRRLLPAALLVQLRRSAELLSLSVAELITSLVGLYLARVTDTEQVCVAAPFLNRTRRSLKVPGQFANPVPLSLSFSMANGTLGESLQKAGQTIRAAMG